MSVARAQREISSREFTEWQVYHELEPLGEERADLRAAIVAYYIVAAASEKNSSRLKIEDFMPKFGVDKQKKHDPADMEAVFRQFASAHNQAMAHRGKRGAS